LRKAGRHEAALESFHSALGFLEKYASAHLWPFSTHLSIQR
jgi:hypothetical protein